MEFLGLHYSIWVVLALYLVAMLALGWWCKRGIHDREGFLLGNRQFGVWYMIMHAFGAGTHPGDVASVTSKTVERGASGIWASWMWIFATPIYWIVAPIVRRMRCLTMADYFEERFGKAASAVYVVVTMVGMTIGGSSVLLATTKTVQGMMGKAAIVGEAKAGEAEAPAAAEAAEPAWKPPGVPRREANAWFIGILFVTTLVFVVYSYWGGIVAAVKTDMAQGLMIIVLSFIAIPAALSLPEVQGWAGAKATVSGAKGAAALSLFDPQYFSFWAVVMLLINAPFSMLAQPHLISVSAAGRTEWEGRVGFTYGNVLKRLCTMGWCILAVCWLAYLIKRGYAIDPDAAFGDSVRRVFMAAPVLQGLMLACVLAAAMSSGDARQVTLGGLFAQNVYRPYVRPEASEEHYVQVTRAAGVVVVAGTFFFCIFFRSVVGAILTYVRVMSALGISVVLGIVWRRMNTPGMLCSSVVALVAFTVARVTNCDQFVSTAVPLGLGILTAIVVSLLTAPPKPEVIDSFFKKIYVVIGEEEKLDLPLDEAIPAEKRLCTAGGLFLVKPMLQTWLGFLITLAICLGLIGVMAALLA